MDQKVFDIAEPMIDKAAWWAHYDWKGVMEFDDIYQELWMFLLERESLQNKVLTGSTEELQNRFRKIANSICANEQVDYEHFSGNFQYTPSDVRAIIDTNETDRTWDENVDYSKGLDRLCNWYPKYYDYVMEFLVEGWPESHTQRRRIHHGLDRLAECMNKIRRDRNREAHYGEGPSLRNEEAEKTVTSWDTFTIGAVTNG